MPMRWLALIWYVIFYMMGILHNIEPVYEFVSGKVLKYSNSVISSKYLNIIIWMHVKTIIFNVENIFKFGLQI